MMALKELQHSALDSRKKTKLKWSNAFVVWTKKPKLALSISEFYNLVNNFTIFKPT